MWNNGSGVPIEIHKEHNVYVPEMIFGKCLKTHPTHNLPQDNF